MIVVSLNIERDRHLGRVIPFIKKYIDAGAVVCLQEVLAETMMRLKRECECEGVFIACCHNQFEHMDDQQGLAMLSRSTIDAEMVIYQGSQDAPPVYIEKNCKIRGVLLVGSIENGGDLYRVITTHFTWTPDGQPTDLQRAHLIKLLAACADYDDLILCGDFNAPRGGEIFARIADVYRDNIPGDITTTIDPDLHRAGDLQLVVDGLFTTKHYDVTDVKVVGGLSDHKAIIAEVGVV